VVCGSNSLTLVAVHVLCSLARQFKEQYLSHFTEVLSLEQKIFLEPQDEGIKSTFGRESKIAVLNDFSKTRRGNLKFIYHHLFFLRSKFLINYFLENEVLVEGMKAVNGP